MLVLIALTLVLILCTLLFGAGAVRGAMSSAVGVLLLFVAVACALAIASRTSDVWREHPGFRVGVLATAVGLAVWAGVCAKYRFRGVTAARGALIATSLGAAIGLGRGVQLDGQQDAALHAPSLRGFAVQVRGTTGLAFAGYLNGAGPNAEPERIIDGTVPATYSVVGDGVSLRIRQAFDTGNIEILMVRDDKVVCRTANSRPGAILTAAATDSTCAHGTLTDAATSRGATTPGASTAARDGVSIPGGEPSAGPADGPVEACVARGVAYFKEIGSYPALTAPPNAGRSADDVARERCQRTTTAF